ncbi:hypothetical protein HanRHA438_Chr03g0135821 [Helianthus annuus]|nr:hypothetical protein HanRHA438_Chr03g0135821 [Helianthus annuus]
MEPLPVPTFVFALWPSDWLLVAVRWGYQTLFPVKSGWTMAFHECKPVSSVFHPSLFTKTIKTHAIKHTQLMIFMTNKQM